MGGVRCRVIGRGRAGESRWKVRAVDRLLLVAPRTVFGWDKLNSVVDERETI